MSFNIALSGLNAAQKDLDVTSNNIANVNTTGFKESRAEFVDVYAASLLSPGKTKVGDGALTSDVAQQFSQGSISFTNNALDLAITGNGFFATVPSIDSLETSYTRAGEFKLNSDNFVVNSAGDYLLGFPVNDDGSSSSVSLSTTNPIQIPTASGSPQASTEVDIRMNLPAGDDYKAIGAFDPSDPLTYNHSTSVTIYDSLGDSHIMTYYFVKPNPNDTIDPATGNITDYGRPNEWVLFTGVDGSLVNIDDPANPAAQAVLDAAVVTADATLTAADTALTAAQAAVIAAPADPVAAATLVTAQDNYDTALQASSDAHRAQDEYQTRLGPADPNTGERPIGARLVFDSSGDFQEIYPANGIVTEELGNGILNNGAEPSQTIEIDFNLDPDRPTAVEPTQYASNFEVTSLSQDGLAVGRLTGIDIGTDGLVRATYSNGTSQPLSRIALVGFPNEQGLTQVGGTAWKESLLSGIGLAGEAGTGTFGTINSSALEQANVNLTTELIDLISAQRNFQANSRALEVDNQLNQTILQIR